MAKVIFDSEKELEDLIVSDMKSNKECPITGKCIDYTFQQMTIGQYGIADIVTAEADMSPGFNPHVTYTVYEVKKETIKADAIGQVSRYMTGLNTLLEQSNLKQNFTVLGVLVAPSFDWSGDTGFLLNQSDFIEAYQVECDLREGASFRKIGQVIHTVFEIPEKTGATIINIEKELLAKLAEVEKEAVA